MNGAPYGRGTKVIWHGNAPDPFKVGTVTWPGTIRSEVRWPDRDEPVLTPNTALARARNHHCPWCDELRRRRREETGG